MRVSFPLDELEPVGGQLYGWIFENPAVGRERAVYWGATVDFAPLAYAGQVWKSSMTCEWVPWRARHWRELDGESLWLRYGEQGVEASMYTAGAHHMAENVRLSVQLVQPCSFRVDMSMTVRFNGLAGGDANPHLNVRCRRVVPFEGVFLRPDNLSPAPTDSTQARRVATDFLEPDAFELTETDNGAFLLRPRGD